VCPDSERVALCLSCLLTELLKVRALICGYIEEARALSRKEAAEKLDPADTRDKRKHVNLRDTIANETSATTRRNVTFRGSITAF